MFIKVYGLHSLTGIVKLVSAYWCGKATNVINMLQTINCSNIRKGDANIKRDIENKLIFLNVWYHLRFIKFNNFGTRCLNEPRRLFLSFCCTTRRIFEPLRVFQPGFNTDKYGMYVIVVDTIYGNTFAVFMIFQSQIIITKVFPINNHFHSNYKSFTIYSTP